jgi:hypothetical protein
LEQSSRLRVPIRFAVTANHLNLDIRYTVARSNLTRSMTDSGERALAVVQ